jgi:hypothetical protein
MSVRLQDATGVKNTDGLIEKGEGEKQFEQY